MYTFEAESVWLSAGLQHRNGSAGIWLLNHVSDCGVAGGAEHSAAGSKAPVYPPSMPIGLQGPDRAKRLGLLWLGMYYRAWGVALHCCICFTRYLVQQRHSDRLASNQARARLTASLS